MVGTDLPIIHTSVRKGDDDIMVAVLLLIKVMLMVMIALLWMRLNCYL